MSVCCTFVCGNIRDTARAQLGNRSEPKREPVFLTRLTVGLACGGRNAWSATNRRDADHGSRPVRHTAVGGVPHRTEGGFVCNRVVANQSCSRRDKPDGEPKDVAKDNVGQDLLRRNKTGHNDSEKLITTGLAWALWNLHGEHGFAIVDTKQTDVKYEGCHGHRH